MHTRAAKLGALPYRAGLGLFAGWLVAGCSGTHEPTQALPTPPRASVAATTNVPALLGASIDGLRSRLGSAQSLPANYSDPMTNLITKVSTTGKTDSLAAFRTGGLIVVASYDAHTRRVQDLVVLGRHEDSLMARASLRTSSPNYLLMPVFFTDRPTHLMGLRVVDIKRNR